jgi:mercuric ion transport protein
VSQSDGQQGSRRLMRTGLIGAVVTAVCCFTPVLAILLLATGLGAATGYLDFVLFPALAIFIGLAVHGYLKQKNSSKGAR